LVPGLSPYTLSGPCGLPSPRKLFSNSATLSF
jgi:hypothetical protein